MSADLSENAEFEAAFQHGMALAYHAAHQAEDLALATAYGDRTFAQLNGRTNQLARLLLEHGVSARDIGAGRWVLHDELEPLLHRHGADVTRDPSAWMSWDGAGHDA